MDQNLESRGIDLKMKCQSGPDFQKKIVLRTRVCRTALIWSALESTDPDASNGGSNFEFRHFGAELVPFELEKKFQNLVSPKSVRKFSSEQRFQSFSKSQSSTITRFAPKCRRSEFDPQLNAPGSGLSSALKLSAVRQKRWEKISIFEIIFKILRNWGL